MRRLVVAVLLLAGVTLVFIKTGRPDHQQEITAARATLNDGVFRALVLGDSVARGTGDERGLGIAGTLQRELEALGNRSAAVVNLGIDGARTYNVGRLLARDSGRSAVRRADLIVISIGGNDLYGDGRVRWLAALFPNSLQERTAGRVEDLVGAVRRLNPAARIYVLGLYNPYRRSTHRSWLDRQVNLWDSRLIRRFAAERSVVVVRICDLLDRDSRISRFDRFHPGASGYAAIAGRIASSL